MAPWLYCAHRTTLARALAPTFLINPTSVPYELVNSIGTLITGLLVNYQFCPTLQPWLPWLLRGPWPGCGQTWDPVCPYHIISLKIQLRSCSSSKPASRIPRFLELSELSLGFGFPFAIGGMWEAETIVEDDEWVGVGLELVRDLEYNTATRCVFRFAHVVSFQTIRSLFLERVSYLL